MNSETYKSRWVDISDPNYKMPVKALISKKYASENATSFSDYVRPLEWIQDYCKRNKIKLQEQIVPSWGRFGETEIQLELTFKSDYQLDCFLRRGNEVFPYFEFL